MLDSARDWVSEKYTGWKLDRALARQDYDAAEELADRTGKGPSYVSEAAREQAEEAIDRRDWGRAGGAIAYGEFRELEQRMKEAATDAFLETLKDDDAFTAAKQAVQDHRDHGLIDYDNARRRARTERSRALSRDAVDDAISLTIHFNLKPDRVNRFIEDEDGYDPIKETAEDEIGQAIADGSAYNTLADELWGPRYVFVDEDALADAFKDTLSMDDDRGLERHAARTVEYLRENVPIHGSTSRDIYDDTDAAAAGAAAAGGGCAGGAGGALTSPAFKWRRGALGGGVATMPEPERPAPERREDEERQEREDDEEDEGPSLDF